MTTISIGRDGKWYKDGVRIHRDTAIALLGLAYVEGCEESNHKFLRLDGAARVTDVDYDNGVIVVDADGGAN